jgi:tetratricopeptide (TPR) repeat protein
VGALERLLEKYPQGRWAGEAHRRLVDISLECLFELPAACKHAAAAVAWIENARPGSTSPDSALPLWALADKGGTLDAGALKALGYAIYLRAGTVAYVQASFAEAARCLEAARAALGKDAPAALTEGLERLLAGARASQAVLPDDVRGAAADKATLALSLGVVCNTCCDSARAERFFGRVLAMQGPTRTAKQAAFAHYGKAVALQGQGRPGEAWAAYASSLKSLPGGSWQDETLYRLAMIIETEAEVRFGERPPASNADIAKQEAERLARAAALVKARAEALPHWTELFQRHPQSPHTEAAFYHAAVLLAEAERWQEAVGALERLLEKYPQGRWAGEAYLRLVDISLERLFELPAARKHAATAVAWIKNARPGSISPDSALPLWALADKGGTLDAGALKALGYTIYIRVGTVAYLDQKYEEAAAMFKAAEPLAPPRGFVVVRGHIPTAMERMIEAAKAQKKLTPDKVLKGDPKAKLILQLADIYVQAGQYENAIALCDRVIFTKEETPTPLQRSWAHNQKAAATYWRGDCVSSKAGYLTAVKACPEAPWAPRALFYVGTTTNNYGQDHAGAAEIFKEIVRRYPKSDIADKAAYFVGVMYEVSAEYGQAKAAYEDFLKRYPDSKWVDLVRREHLKRVEEQLAVGVPEPRGRKKR